MSEKNENDVPQINQFDDAEKMVKEKRVFVQDVVNDAVAAIVEQERARRVTIMTACLNFRGGLQKKLASLPPDVIMFEEGGSSELKYYSKERFNQRKAIEEKLASFNKAIEKVLVDTATNKDWDALEKLTKEANKE